MIRLYFWVLNMGVDSNIEVLTKIHLVTQMHLLFLQKQATIMSALRILSHQPPFKESVTAECLELFI